MTVKSASYKFDLSNNNGNFTTTTTTTTITTLPRTKLYETL